MTPSSPIVTGSRPITSLPRPRMRWWGWGVDGHDKPISEDAEQLLVDEIGFDRSAHHPLATLDDISLVESALTDEDLAALAAVVGAEFVGADHESRVRYTYGRSYPDLARLRDGKLFWAPDAVVAPGTDEDIARLFEVCGERGITVTPFAGGTSVVGGVQSVPDSEASTPKTVALSMLRFNQILEINKEAMTLRVQAGVFGPDLEEALAKHDVTVGHFPQSFEFSTVGGWLACRSSGQESSGYGRIDRNVIGMRVVTPAGIMDLRDMPSTAAGPNPRELFLGSEGTLGIITEATIQLHHRPKKMLFDTYFFPSFEEAEETFRVLRQSNALPHLARVSDEEETRFGLAQLGGSIAGKLKKYLSLRGQETPCMVVFGFGRESQAASRAERETLALKLLTRKCARVGAIPGMMWVKNRFSTPYLRDVMMRRGVAVDTLETCTTWDNAVRLRAEIVRRMKEAGEEVGSPAFVFSHISHVYGSGCSLYFTYFFTERSGDMIQQWSAIKSAAGSAISECGGTITHHHGVGQDHAPEFYPETTELYAEALRAVKATLDPKGVLNPGKLFNGPRDLVARYAEEKI